MMKKIKKHISLLVALCILFVLMPGQAAATPITGTIGSSGAAWALDNGVLTVQPGAINWNHGTQSPWYPHCNDIYMIEFTGTIIAGPRLRNLFSGLSNVHTITGLAYFETNGVNYMTSMFNDTSSLVNVGDLSGWDTSNVTNMHGMFRGASSLTALDLSGWDVSSVSTMRDMFRDAFNLTCIGDVSAWETGSVSSMYGMFMNANNLKNLSLSDWDTGAVTTMAFMFSGASHLATLDLSGWDVSSVTNMDAMFRDAHSLTELDLSGWDTSAVTDMARMFQRIGLAELDLSGWDTSHVTNMFSMFAGSNSLTSLDLIGWDTGNVTNMSSMFALTPALRQLTLGTEFHFELGGGSPALPNVPANAVYTGHWINTETEETATSAVLMNSSDLAGTWVWHRSFKIAPLDDHVFPPAPLGYDPQTSHIVTVTSIGALPTGDLTITLSGENPDAFTLSTTLLTNIHPGETATFTVIPNTGLPVGTHTAIVTVSSNEGLVPQSFELVFTVLPLNGGSPPSFTVTYTVTGVRPPLYTGMPASPQTAAAGTTVMVSGIPTTTATTNAAGVIGTWTFNGWHHATITDPTFAMPNNNVVFTGYWAFAPATSNGGDIPDEDVLSGDVPSGGREPDASAPDQPGTGGLNPFSPYHNSFIIGRPNGNIYPGATMTRAEVTTVFFRLLSDASRIQMWNQQNPFSDVDSTDWFNNAVSTMANAGIVQGRPGGTFQPNQPITRAEVAAITARFFEEPDQVQGAFTDTSGHWAEGYVNRLAQFGWVQGSGDGTFRPDDLITRAEVAAIVNRMLNRVLDSEDSLLDGRIHWPDKTNLNAWYYLYLQEASHSTEFARLANGSLKWTALLSHIEWSLLERPDSRPDDIRVSRR